MFSKEQLQQLIDASNDSATPDSTKLPAGDVTGPDVDFDYIAPESLNMMVLDEVCVPHLVKGSFTMQANGWACWMHKRPLGN